MTATAQGKPGGLTIVPGAWPALAILCVGDALRNVDRVLIGVLAPALKTDFSLDDSQIGMLSMAFAIAYAICGVPFGRWADNGSRRLVITLVMSVWSAMTALCGVAQSYALLFVGRMGVAVGEAGYLPSAFSMISDLFPPRLRNLALGAITCTSSVGVFFGLAMGGWLAEHHGWRAAFLALGLPGLLLATIIWFGLRDPPRGSTEELVYEQSGEMGTWAAIGALAGNRLYVWLTISASLNVFSAIGLVQWLPSFFTRVHGMSLAEVGLIFGIAFGAGMLIGQFAGAWIGTRLARRGIFAPLKVCIWVNLMLVPSYLLAFWVADPRLAMAFVMIGAALGAVPHPIQTAGTQTALPPQIRATGHAVLALLSALIAMGLGPLLIGALSDMFLAMGYQDSLRYALSLVLVLFLIAAFAAWRACRLGAAREAAG